MKNLPPGSFIVGNKLMARCDDCGSLVQLNKTFFGDLHLCLTDEERAYKKRQETRKILNEVLLRNTRSK